MNEIIKLKKYSNSRQNTDLIPDRTTSPSNFLTQEDNNLPYKVFIVNLKLPIHNRLRRYRNDQKRDHRDVKDSSLTTSEVDTYF